MMLAGQTGARQCVEWKCTGEVVARIAPIPAVRGTLGAVAGGFSGLSARERSVRVAARVGDLRRLARKYAALTRGSQSPLSFELPLVG